MNSVLDDLLVAAVLAVSLGYAILKLGPRTWRQRIFRRLSGILAAAPSFLKLAGAAQKLAAASGKVPAACGGCDTCGEPAPTPQAPSEISVPVAKIQRRA